MKRQSYYSDLRRHDSSPSGAAAYPCMRWSRDAFDPFVEYDAGTVIQHESCVYISTQKTSPGVKPSDKRYWDLLTQQLYRRSHSTDPRVLAEVHQSTRDISSLESRLNLYLESAPAMSLTVDFITQVQVISTQLESVTYDTKSSTRDVADIAARVKNASTSIATLMPATQSNTSAISSLANQAQTSASSIVLLTPQVQCNTNSIATLNNNAHVLGTSLALASHQVQMNKNSIIPLADSIVDVQAQMRALGGSLSSIGPQVQANTLLINEAAAQLQIHVGSVTTLTSLGKTRDAVTATVTANIALLQTSSSEHAQTLIALSSSAHNLSDGVCSLDTRVLAVEKLLGDKATHVASYEVQLNSNTTTLTALEPTSRSNASSILVLTPLVNQHALAISSMSQQLTAAIACLGVAPNDPSYDASKCNIATALSVLIPKVQINSDSIVEFNRSNGTIVANQSTLTSKCDETAMDLEHLVTRVSSCSDDVGTLTIHWGDNTIRVDNISARIDAIESSIETLKSLRVTAVDLKQIQDSTVSIAALASQLNALVASITLEQQATTASMVQTNAQMVNNTTGISGLVLQIQGYSASVSSLQAQLDSTSTALSGATANIGTLMSQYQAQNASIVSIAPQVQSVTASVNAVTIQSQNTSNMIAGLVVQLQSTTDMLHALAAGCAQTSVDVSNANTAAVALKLVVDKSVCDIATANAFAQTLNAALAQNALSTSGCAASLQQMNGTLAQNSQSIVNTQVAIATLTAQQTSNARDSSNLLQQTSASIDRNTATIAAMQTSLTGTNAALQQASSTIGIGAQSIATLQTAVTNMSTQQNASIVSIQSLATSIAHDEKSISALQDASNASFAAQQTASVSSTQQGSAINGIQTSLASVIAAAQQCNVLVSQNTQAITSNAANDLNSAASSNAAIKSVSTALAANVADVASLKALTAYMQRSATTMPYAEALVRSFTSSASDTNYYPITGLTLTPTPPLGSTWVATVSMQLDCLSNNPAATIGVFVNGVELTPYTRSINEVTSAYSTSPWTMSIYPALSTFSVFTSAGVITNAGESTILGVVGSAAGAVSGFTTTGSSAVSIATLALSAQAKFELSNFFIQLGKLKAASVPLSATPVMSGTFTAGCYVITGASAMPGVIALDAQGDSTATFVFSIAGALSVAPSCSVQLLNGALATNVIFEVTGAITTSGMPTLNGIFVVHSSAISIAAGTTMVQGAFFVDVGAISITSLKIAPLVIISNVLQSAYSVPYSVSFMRTTDSTIDVRFKRILPSRVVTVTNASISLLRIA